YHARRRSLTTAPSRPHSVQTERRAMLVLSPRSRPWRCPMKPSTRRILSTLALAVVCAPRALAVTGPGTFPIGAYDSVTQELGVGVQSKYFSVGSVVPWAEAGVGAVATQAQVNASYGPQALAMLRKNLAPDEILRRFAVNDTAWSHRQLGIA